MFAKCIQYIYMHAVPIVLVNIVDDHIVLGSMQNLNFPLSCLTVGDY